MGRASASTTAEEADARIAGRRWTTACDKDRISRRDLLNLEVVKIVGVKRDLYSLPATRLRFALHYPCNLVLIFRVSNEKVCGLHEQLLSTFGCAPLTDQDACFFPETLKNQLTRLNWHLPNCRILQYDASI